MTYIDVHNLKLEVLDVFSPRVSHGIVDTINTSMPFCDLLNLAWNFF